MIRKAKVVVTVHVNPVQPVSMDDSPAANIHFGEMTAGHARRDRRRMRRQRRHFARGHSPLRFC